MTIGRLAIVAALADETRDIVRLLEDSVTVRAGDVSFVAARVGAVEVLLLLTGIGEERAGQRTRALLAAESVDALLAVGFAGGLRDVHLAGDVVVAEDLVAASPPWGEGPEGFSSAPELLQLVPTELDVPQLVRRGRMATVRRILGTAREKRELGRQDSADVVDMESVGIARAAREANVPALFARAVVDDCEMDLPLDFSRLVTETGKPRPGRLLAALSRRPWAIRGLLDLRRRTLKASASLASLVGRILENNEREMERP